MPPKKTTTTPRTQAGPTQEDLQAAYQIHTLAQMMYGRLYGAQMPWRVPRPQFDPYTARTQPETMERMPYAAMPNVMTTPQFVPGPTFMPTTPYGMRQPYGMTPGLSPFCCGPFGWYR